MSKSARRSSFLGQDGFVWWIGVVVDRKDPLNCGRCKVRIKGIHAENVSEVANADLPWAQPLNPVNNSFQSPSTLREGDFVMGFFMDGEQGQFPIVMGQFSTIPEAPAEKTESGFSDPRTSSELKLAPQTIKTIKYKTDGTGVTIENEDSKKYPHTFNEPLTSRLCRNETTDKTIIKTKKDSLVKDIQYSAKGKWNEPTSPYKALYPYNHVIETESGHIIELDDTKDAERLHFYHRSGTFTEMHPKGDKVQKIVGDNYEIVMKNNMLYVMGDCNLTVQKDCNIKIDGNMNLDVANDCNIKIGGKMNMDVIGKVNWNFTAATTWNFKSTLDWNVSGATNWTFKTFNWNTGSYITTASSTMTLVASTINLN